MKRFAIWHRRTGRWGLFLFLLRRRFGGDEDGPVICCSALRRMQGWSDRTHESFNFNVRRYVSGRMLIALVTLLRACVL
jgi:hypothetical protein